MMANDVQRKKSLKKRIWCVSKNDAVMLLCLSCSRVHFLSSSRFDRDIMCNKPGELLGWSGSVVVSLVTRGGALGLITLL